jgi:protein-L-isoaspartate(D-aspartate) O-methyltransferase
MDTFEIQRELMVERTVARRGITDPRVLGALRSVPRHLFVPEALVEFAYRDTPLTIAEGQTISQPYIVALMTEALQLQPGDRLLEIGTGSAYPAAVAARICREVFSIERHAALAATARERLRQMGFLNVQVKEGDGTLGWPEQAPFDAIVVTAGGPKVPPTLVEQLAVGGRLVLPVGPEDAQVLVRIKKQKDGSVVREELGAVRFVPLIGAHGWAGPVTHHSGEEQLVREALVPIDGIESAELSGFLERVGDAKVVLLGEATHGTSEFYRWRARLTRELVMHRGFNLIAAEADWPDAARIDRHVRHLPKDQRTWRAFERFPQWMWRNYETVDLMEWLRAHNAEVRGPDHRVGFFGLDLYSLFTSASEVIRSLARIDPLAADVARARYGLLTPWQFDPAAYGHAALAGRYQEAEGEVVQQLKDLLERRIEHGRHDGDRFFDAVCNARVVASAERYYRAMYYGSVESWNLRDQHMFDTLQALLHAGGPRARAVVWAHNSHVGDAAATELSERCELNLGHLCRRHFGDKAYLVGFGTDHGTVMAARGWEEPGERMKVRPAQSGSYEALFHKVGVPAFMLPLRSPRRLAVREALTASRLERAIGVVYGPGTELMSHSFDASLPGQFDEYVWFDETRALNPLHEQPAVEQVPDTWPFGL